MKQKIFTLMILLALVVAGGKAFGQNSKMSPTVNSSWTYNVNNLTATDGITFKINGSATDYTAAASGGTITGTSGATVPAGGTATADVTWGSSTGTFYLWVNVILNGGTCSNYRNVTITVVANTFDVVLYAIGADAAAIYDDALWTGATDDTEDCPDFVATTFDFNMTGGASDGNTYVFFRVNRTGGNAASTWVFDFTESTDEATAIDYYNGTAWVLAYTEGDDITVDADVNNILVRLTIPNAPAGYNVTGVLADILETVGSKPDLTAANNTKTIAISAMPDLSGVTFD